MTTIPIEVEAKLLAPDARALTAIARLRTIGPYRLRPRPAARLRSVYLDTRDLTLARRGIALRLRRRGRRWELTAKWGGRRHGAIHQRPELTIPINGSPTMPLRLPRGDLQERLGAVVGRRALRPILVTEIHRRCCDVFANNDRHRATVVAEIALDRVRLLAPHRPRTADVYTEVEIEQRAGSRQDVRALARALRRRFGLVTARDSKFSRGLSFVRASVI